MAHLLLPAPERLHRLGDRDHDGWTPRRNLAIGGRYREGGTRDHGWYLNPEAGLSDPAWHRGRMALIAAARSFVWVERTALPSGNTGLRVRVPQGAARWHGVHRVPFAEPIPTKVAHSDFAMQTQRALRERRQGGVAGGLTVADVLNRWQGLELAMARPGAAAQSLFVGSSATQLGFPDLGA